MELKCEKRHINSILSVVSSHGWGGEKAIREKAKYLNTGVSIYGFELIKVPSDLLFHHFPLVLTMHIIVFHSYLSFESASCPSFSSVARVDMPIFKQRKAAET